jgi:putative membrane protein
MLGYVYMHNMGWGWGILLTIASLAILGLLVGVVLTAVRDQGSPSPREILDRRLAAGEIDLDEFGRARAAMSREGSGAWRQAHRQRPEAADWKRQVTHRCPDHHQW